MNRRRFIQRGGAATVTGLIGGSAFASAGASTLAPALGTVDTGSARMDANMGSPDPFNLNYAPHLGMFRNSAGQDPLDQIGFMADRGFRALEDNGMKGRSLQTQEGMARVMASRGMTMGVFVAHTIFWNEPNLASGKSDWRDQFLAEIRESVEVARRVNATWMTVVPGHVDLRLDLGYQTANVVESLKQACAILEPHGLVMVLEPLNRRDHPGLFLTGMPQAYSVCKAVGSPSCKILDDLYHQQITEGNLIPNIDAAWDEIAYFQVGDNPGRKEPTTGEINYRNVFKHIAEKGFTGVVGMEHGNSVSGAEGEEAVIAAYREVDSF
jgi:hydroxypyruvate isomerase